MLHALKGLEKKIEKILKAIRTKEHNPYKKSKKKYDSRFTGLFLLIFFFLKQAVRMQRNTIKTLKKYIIV